MKTSIAIAALVVAAIGVGSVVPTIAQDASSTPADPASPKPQIGLSLNDDTANPAGPDVFDTRVMKPGRGMMGMGANGAILALACSPMGAEALDVALLRLSYRLQLTDAQKPLYDDFRTKALTTQTTFADSCKADLPAKPAAGAAPDFLDRLKSRLSLQQAELTALNDVLPSFEALYNSLTDAQKATFLPRGGMMMHRHLDRGGMDRMQRQDAPGRT